MGVGLLGKLIDTLKTGIGGNVLGAGGRHSPCAVDIHRDGAEVIRLFDFYLSGDHVSVTIKLDPKGIAGRVKASQEQKKQATADAAKKKTLEGFK